MSSVFSLKAKVFLSNNLLLMTLIPNKIYIFLFSYIDNEKNKVKESRKENNQQ